jgi:predicted GH43/DUF377 family glycosyl hydrolase
MSSSTDSSGIAQLRAGRVADEPIVTADAVDGYGPVFNAGVLYHDGCYHLFARAVRNGYRRNRATGPRFLDYVSDIVVFTSVDGHTYEWGYVLAAARDGVYAYEDPRVQWVHSEGQPHLVMTYTRLEDPALGRPWRIGAHLLRYADGRFHLDEHSATLLGPEGVPNKDAVVFNLADGRVAMIHRIHPDAQLAVFDTIEHLWAPDARYWDRYLAALGDHVLLVPGRDATGVGAGAPPVEIAEGLLLLFHERERSGRYTAKVALLDPTTGRVSSHIDEPVLVPELSWELVGDVDHVVFPQGAHVRPDDTVYFTYGAADRCVGAATIALTDVRRHIGRVA